MIIYSTSNLPKDYYVYAYLRSSDKTPYYIGKGLGKRAWSKAHNVNVPEDYSRIVIIVQGLTDLGALALERRFIKWYGRKDNNTGILRNLTDGGEGGSGATRSKETRIKISLGLKGKINNKGANNPMYGKKHSDAVKLASSIRRSNTNKSRRWYNNGNASTFLPNHPGEGWKLGRIMPERIRVRSNS